jgi:hypothetical protein
MRIIMPNVRLPNAPNFFPRHGYQPPTALLAGDSHGDPYTYKKGVGSQDASELLSAI